jgi:hypothetical protein
MNFTTEAQVAWDGIPEPEHERLLSNGFCTRCLATRHFTLDQGEMRNGELAMIGRCDTCGARVVKLINVPA